MDDELDIRDMFSTLSGRPVKGKFFITLLSLHIRKLSKLNLNFDQNRWTCFLNSTVYIYHCNALEGGIVELQGAADVQLEEIVVTGGGDAGRRVVDEEPLALVEPASGD